MRVPRYDYATARIVVVDSPQDPEVGVAPAVRTDEGYLLADAFLARDGSLVYSDGTDEWIEFRPREELERAADSWTFAPVTDDHPKDMVTADTWTEVSRGLTVSRPTLTPPQMNGRSYLHARLLIADADLLQRIESGEQVEVSIGFTTKVVPTADGRAPDGSEAFALQTDLAGNHVAIVTQGRSGPVVRVLLDSAAWTAYNGKGPHDMKFPPKNSPAKADAVGAPTETVEIPAPDGTMAQVPTWVAAMLQELQTLKAQALAPPAEPAQPAASAVPAAEAVAAPAPAVAPAPKPEEEEDAKAEDMEMDPDEDEDEKTKDAMNEKQVTRLVRKRARLERLAVKAGIPEAKIDTADDAELAREFVAVKIPTAKPLLERCTGDQLGALVETAASLPEPAKDEGTGRNDAVAPWAIRHPGAVRNDDADAEAQARFLQSQGY